MQFKHTLFFTVATAISFNSFSQTGSAQTQICYPKYQSESEYCQVVLVDENTFLNGLIGPSEIENGLTAISNYGFEITDTLEKIDIQNPLLEALILSQKDKVIEAISAVGGAPGLAILNLALNNTLTGGSATDPISTMTEIILKRLAEVESRVIARIDDQFQSEAQDAFNGLTKLYEIYGTADTIEKRTTPLYLERLSTVDTSLDILIENFENARFTDAHVKNYHVYLELVALRLAVLAEVERITYFQIYGDSLVDAHSEYKTALEQQYRLVLADVFDYVDTLASSNEWEEESNKRFDFNYSKSFSISSKEVTTTGGRATGTKNVYISKVRPLLFSLEREHADKVDSYRTSGRLAKTVYYTKGSEMNFSAYTYKFANINQNVHFSIFKSLGGNANKYSFYLAHELFDGQMKQTYSCSDSRYLPSCDSSTYAWKYKSQGAIEEHNNYHKERAFHQFVNIYYKSTQEILNQWYELYRPGEQRPDNRLDVMISDMI